MFVEQHAPGIQANVFHEVVVAYCSRGLCGLRKPVWICLPSQQAFTNPTERPLLSTQGNVTTSPRVHRPYLWKTSAPLMRRGMESLGPLIRSSSEVLRKAELLRTARNPVPKPVEPGSSSSPAVSD